MKAKKLLTWILAVLLVVMSVCLVACVDKPDAQKLDVTLPNLDDKVAVIFNKGNDEYVVYTVDYAADLKTGVDVIQKLADDGEITVDWSDSSYGKFINAIGPLQPDASKNEYVTVLTSVAKDKGNFAGATTYIIGDVTIVSAQVGISEMSVESGAIIYFEIATY